MVDYITKDSIIIFSLNFNDKLDIEFLSNYKQIIFSNYELNDEIFNAYANNDFYYLNYICSEFNQSIELHENLIHLTFSYFF